MASPLNDTVPRRTPDPELSPNRKLIRPSLAEVRDQLARNLPAAGAVPAASAPLPPRLPKKPVPPDQTNAESFYFLKQMQAKTEMVLVLRDGEQIRGVIEWYDRHCLKVHRAGEPNLLIYKATIKYMYKAEDEKRDGILAHD
ncbi:MAG TPA: RNA chaperone Hfq [Terriglobales bacterium]|nr:RNA chaperone Hfq [Terriglobales bacterium]